VFVAGITLYKSLQVTDGVSITSAPTKAREGANYCFLLLNVKKQAPPRVGGAKSGGRRRQQRTCQADHSASPENLTLKAVRLRRLPLCTIFLIIYFSVGICENPDCNRAEGNGS